jgi:type II secretory pathway pseudopilin PulG
MVSSHHQRGVTYIALLLAVAITSGVAAAGASVWSQMQRREREKQLLWAGDQIRRAILACSTPAAPRRAGTCARSTKTR